MRSRRSECVGRQPAVLTISLAICANAVASLPEKWRGYGMELAGLEPATSWVRSRRSPN
jgi:hypothetical protein